MNANNVLKFPGATNFKEFSTPEGLGNHFEENKKLYLDSIVDFYVSQLINRLGIHGFAIYEDKFLDDFSITVEMLRATLYRSLELENALHPEMDRIVGMISAMEEGYFDEDDEFVD